jgi:hypothetical protein
MDNTTGASDEYEKDLLDRIRTLGVQSDALLDAYKVANRLPDLERLRNENPQLYTVYFIRLEPLIFGGDEYLAISEIEDAWVQARLDWQAIQLVVSRCSVEQRRTINERYISFLWFIVPQLVKEVASTALLSVRQEYIENLVDRAMKKISDTSTMPAIGRGKAGAPVTPANKWAISQFESGLTPQEIRHSYAERYNDERSTPPDKALRDLYGRWKSGRRR